MSGNVCLFPRLAPRCQAGRSMAPPAAGNGAVGWGNIPFLPPGAARALTWSLAGLTTGRSDAPRSSVPSWASQTFPPLPSGTGTGVCHAPPRSFPFLFYSNCLNLISSSAHHSLPFDDTNQVVGGFVTAVSDTLIKAGSIRQEEVRYDLILVL